MSLFKRKKTKSDPEQPTKTIRCAIEDSFSVSEDIPEAAIEEMIARVAKGRKFIWTDDPEEDLFDYGYEE